MGRAREKESTGVALADDFHSDASELVATSEVVTDPRVEEALELALRPAGVNPPPQPQSSREPRLEDLPLPEEGQPKQPFFGTPRPLPIGGEIPRVVHQLHRAPAGYCRYKIHCRNYSPQPIRYILSTPDAEGEVAARRLYVRLQDLAAMMQHYANTNPGEGKIEPPSLVVTKLAD